METGGDDPNTLQLGGMTLKRRSGGVDIEPRNGSIAHVRIQDADMVEVVTFLQESVLPNHDGPIGGRCSYPLKPANAKGKRHSEC